MSTLKGIVKFGYGDNRFEARDHVQKDLHKLGTCDALNAPGVSYKTEFDIINEPEDGWPDGRYYAEIEIRIEGSELGPAEMKDAIDSAMADVAGYDHAFIYD